jgi:hypothetical protein
MKGLRPSAGANPRSIPIAVLPMHVRVGSAEAGSAGRLLTLGAAPEDFRFDPI